MDLGWISLESSRSRWLRADRRRRALCADIERLEGRALLAITAGPISASAGHAFSGLVATLDQSDVSGSTDQLTANIVWGDGQSSAGTLALVGTTYQVQGTHTYAAQGSYTLRVTVTGTGSPPSQVSDEGTATVAATPITVTGLTITPTLGQPFSGDVATFSDTYENLTASSYNAIITWGDGQFSKGTISSTVAGSYTVSGSHTYANAPAAGTAKVQIQRLVDNETAAASFEALGNPANGSTVAFSGALDPSSDTGVSNTDWITSINQPVFRGTAPPYSIVQVLARPQGQSDLVSLGQTVADPTGNWTLAAAPIRDGVYALFANIAPPQGFPVQAIPLAANNQLVIDTMGPRVVSVVPGQKNRRILVSFQDQLSGLELSTLTHPANYVLIGPHPRRAAPQSVSLRSAAAVLTNDPQMVLVNARSTFSVTGLRIVAGGVRDVAGNPLNGLYTGTLPSGGHPQGSSFVYRFPRPIRQVRPVVRPLPMRGYLRMPRS